MRIYASRAAAHYPGCDDRGPIRDAQAAKLSIQFAVASVLVAGGVSDENWRNFTDPRTNALAARATVFVDDTLGLDQAPGCRIDTTLDDGRTWSERHEGPVTMDDAEIAERFAQVARPRLGAQRANEALALIARLEQLDDVGALAGLLRSAQ